MCGILWLAVQLEFFILIARALIVKNSKFSIRQDLQKLRRKRTKQCIIFSLTKFFSYSRCVKETDIPWKSKSAVLKLTSVLQALQCVECYGKYWWLSQFLYRFQNFYQWKCITICQYWSLLRLWLLSVVLFKHILFQNGLRVSEINNVLWKKMKGTHLITASVKVFVIIIGNLGGLYTNWI